jgi:hypothetical protein
MRLAMVLVLALAAELHAAAQAPEPAAHPGQQVFAPNTPATLAEWDRTIALMIRHGDLKRTEERKSEAGIRHDEWFVQLYKGVPVAGTEVWRRSEGKTTVALEGTVYAGIDVNPVPKLTRDEALDRLATLGGGLGPSLPPKLVIQPTTGGRYRLVYQARLFTDTDLTLYSLDATTGDVVSNQTEPDRPP